MNFHDPKRYRERSIPRDKEAAIKSLDAFFKELDSMVQKHAIQDLTVSAVVPVTVPPRDLTEEEFEGHINVVGHFGDERRAVEMAAYAMGYWRSRRSDAAMRLESDGAKAAGRL